MLRLAAPSPRAWLDLALSDMDTILVDHAHCEKKAASTAINLIFRYPDKEELLLPLSRLAREELEHFERVLELLNRRGVPFHRLEPPPYAARLHEVCAKAEPRRLVDTLLCCAFIEARSCERMKLLSETLPDPELAALYKDLLASEARHHQLYVDLARTWGGSDERLAEIAAWEARCFAEAPREVRLHS